MQLDAVEARLARAARGRRRRARAARAAARGCAAGATSVDPLAVAVVERLELARRRAPRPATRSSSAGERARTSSLGRVRQPASPSAAPGASRCASSTARKRAKYFVALGPAADGEEVDELDEQPRAGRRCARAPSRPAAASPGTKRSWPMRSSGPLGTSRMPVASTTITPGCPSAKRAYHSSTSGGDEAVLGRAPGHHRRHPGALGGRAAGPMRDRREPARAAGPPRRSASAPPGGMSDPDRHRRDDHGVSLPRGRAGGPRSGPSGPA